MHAIQLTQGKQAIVDAEDYEALAAFKWHAQRGKRTWYAARNVVLPDGRKRIARMHRVLLPSAPMVDHINGDGLDNRRSNLRPVTPLQNCWNMTRKRRRASSRFKGVTANRRTGKWEAYLVHLGKTLYLGTFTNEQDAARAYDAKARALFGQYASPNFPEES